MKRILVGLLVLVLALAWLPVVNTYAVNPTVTVSATGQYLSFSNTPDTWTVGGLTGSGFLVPNTIYYANPAGDTTAPASTVLQASCNFTITNGSNVNVAFTVNWANFSGGDAMTNHNATPPPGANSFAAAIYWVGETSYPSTAVICKASGSSAFITAVAPATTSVYWGAQITTQTGAWASGNAETAIMTLSVAAA